MMFGWCGSWRTSIAFIEAKKIHASLLPATNLQIVHDFYFFFLKKPLTKISPDFPHLTNQHGSVPC